MIVVMSQCDGLHASLCIFTCLHLTESDAVLAVTLFLWLFRAFEEESKARLGLVECAKHELVQPFTVLYEKEGELGFIEQHINRVTASLDTRLTKVGRQRCRLNHLCRLSS